MDDIFHISSGIQCVSRQSANQVTQFSLPPWIPFGTPGEAWRNARRPPRPGRGIRGILGVFESGAEEPPHGARMRPEGSPGGRGEVQTGSHHSLFGAESPRPPHAPPTVPVWTQKWIPKRLRVGGGTGSKRSLCWIRSGATKLISVQKLFRNGNNF